MASLCSGSLAFHWMTIPTHLRFAGSRDASVDSIKSLEKHHKHFLLVKGCNNGEGFCIVIPWWLSLLQNHGPLKAAGQLALLGRMLDRYPYTWEGMCARYMFQGDKVILHDIMSMCASESYVLVR